MTKHYGYVYMTYDMHNNMKYIGQHKGEFTSKYLGSGKAICNSINKYGADNFRVELLKYANSKEELNSLEIEYISKYNAVVSREFYNISSGGTGNMFEGMTDYEKKLHTFGNPKEHRKNVFKSLTKEQISLRAKSAAKTRIKRYGSSFLDNNGKPFSGKMHPRALFYIVKDFNSNTILKFYTKKEFVNWRKANSYRVNRDYTYEIIGSSRKYFKGDCKMKRQFIEIDGVDRTGKDTLHKYIEQLSNYKYIINTRGILTQLAYTEKFNRGYEYDLECYKKNYVIVLLSAEPEDLAIRCKMTNEPDYTIESDLKLFQEKSEMLENEYGATVLRYNTTDTTPYNIAKDVVARLEQYNKARD